MERFVVDLQSLVKYAAIGGNKQAPKIIKAIEKAIISVNQNMNNEPLSKKQTKLVQFALKAAIQDNEDDNTSHFHEDYVEPPTPPQLLRQHGYSKSTTSASTFKDNNEDENLDSMFEKITSNKSMALPPSLMKNSNQTIVEGSGLDLPSLLDSFDKFDLKTSDYQYMLKLLASATGLSVDELKEMTKQQIKKLFDAYMKNKSSKMKKALNSAAKW